MSFIIETFINGYFISIVMVMKRGTKKDLYLTVFSVVVVLMLGSFVSADFFDWITGKASNQPTNVSVTITGSNPVVVEFVLNNTIGVASPTEANVTNLNFEVHVSDADGVDDINDTSVTFNFSKAGEPLRFNSSVCTHVGDIDATTANYTCSTDMFFFDDAGTWSIGVGANDVGNGTAQYNNTQTFVYSQLKALVVSPPSLTWATLSSGSLNQSSNNDPTVINNTGNFNGTINVTGVNLLGETTPSNYIDVANFTVGLATGSDIECDTDDSDGASLVNGTAAVILNSVSNRGNLSAGSGAGQENFYYCIPQVPTVPSQTYSTDAGGSWTIIY